MKVLLVGKGLVLLAARHHTAVVCYRSNDVSEVVPVKPCRY